MAPMIAHIDSPVARAWSVPYQIKVVLLGTKPPIWRRLSVPSNANLGWLHAALQVAMGWTNSHLHQFRAGRELYSDTRCHYAEFEGDPEILEESKVTLGEIARHEKDTFRYEYDFGDSWDHHVMVEKILAPEAEAATFALCLGGARACPPEDCGGIWGYDNLLKVLKDKKHPEHKEMKEWLNRPLDPTAFDVAEINSWLQKLKRPRVTEAQLRKVLMARDGYRE